MTTPAQPPARKKGLLSNPWAIVIVAGVALLGGAWLLYRRRNAASATAGATGTPTADQLDTSGQIATLQAEVANLQSSEAQEPADSDGSKPPGPEHKPGMPSAVKVTGTTDTSIKLSWSKVTGATSYKVHVTSHAPISGKLVTGATVSVTGTTATVGGLSPLHTYTCHVAACNSEGCSAATNGPVARTKGIAKIPVKAGHGGKGGGERED